MDDTTSTSSFSQEGASVAVNDTEQARGGAEPSRPWPPPVVTRLEVERTLFLAGSKADAFSPSTA